MPFTLQVTAVSVEPATVAAYCEVVPSVTLVDPLRLTVTTGWLGACGVVSPTTRLCAVSGSATLAAVIVTVPDPGVLAGAAYRPEFEMDPTVASPPEIPFTLQVTIASELPDTVAEYCDCAPSATVAGPLTVIATVEAVAVPVLPFANPAAFGLLTTPHAVSTSTSTVPEITVTIERNEGRMLVSSVDVGLSR
jgi:hypothetical protein